MEQMKAIIKPEHSSIEWLRLRNRDEKGSVIFGASEAPALMDRSIFESRADLIHRKMTEPKVSDPSPAMATGNLLEPVLVEEAARRLGLDLITPSIMFGKDRFVATPDAIDRRSAEVISTMLGGSDSKSLDQGSVEAWVEVKTTSRYSVRSKDEIPELWLWQLSAQSMITKAPIFLIVLDSNLHVNLFEVDPMPEAEDALAQTAETLGKVLDEGMIPEDDFGRMSDEQIADLFISRAVAVELGFDDMEWIIDLEDARATKKQAEEREKRAKDHLARRLKDAQVGVFDGATVISWKEQKGRSRIDLARLEVDHPDLLARYQVDGAPFRVMRTSLGKKKK